MSDFEAGYITIFLICLISSVLIWNLYKSSGVNSHLPPTPFVLPVIGHLHLLSRLPHQAFHKLSNRHGPVFRLSLGSTPCIVASTPETAKDVFKMHDSAFLDRPINSVVKYLSYEGKGFVFAPYGPFWKFGKKIMVTELLNSKTLDFLYPVREDERNRLIKLISQKAKEGKSVNLEVKLLKLTSNVISRMFMSKRCSEEEGEAEDIIKIIADSAKIIEEFNITDHIWFYLQGLGKRSKDIHRRYDALVERITREHEEARKQKRGEMKDLLNILLDISENENMEIKLTRENIKAILQWKAGKNGDLATVDMEEGVGATLPRANPLVCVPVARLDPIPLPV
ncbi:hypothetical protein L1987_50987 [Smallanthus sonchifolius]|uniref:Uncharacterized protein n=1 Tax=Smallanthus sonchifolius TaxID=185202 RepID=A0ACB9EP45_9ASTR|nr:hypothetical protein L1987_50987 [Smallanthus sonchifolius]